MLLQLLLDNPSVLLKQLVHANAFDKLGHQVHSAVVLEGLGKCGQGDIGPVAQILLDGNVVSITLGNGGRGQYDPGTAHLLPLVPTHGPLNE